MHASPMPTPAPPDPCLHPEHAIGSTMLKSSDGLCFRANLEQLASVSNFFSTLQPADTHQSIDLPEATGGALAYALSVLPLVAPAPQGNVPRTPTPSRAQTNDAFHSAHTYGPTHNVSDGPLPIDESFLDAAIALAFAYDLGPILIPLAARPRSPFTRYTLAALALASTVPPKNAPAPSDSVLDAYKADLLDTSVHLGDLGPWDECTLEARAPRALVQLKQFFHRRDHVLDALADEDGPEQEDSDEQPGYVDAWYAFVGWLAGEGVSAPIASGRTSGRASGRATPSKTHSPLPGMLPTFSVRAHSTVPELRASDLWSCCATQCKAATLALARAARTMASRPQDLQAFVSAARGDPVLGVECDDCAIGLRAALVATWAAERVPPAWAERNGWGEAYWADSNRYLADRLKRRRKVAFMEVSTVSARDEEEWGGDPAFEIDMDDEMEWEMM